MTTDDAIALLGPTATTLDLAEALGITRPAIYQWRGTVPPLRVYQIQSVVERRRALAATDTHAQAA